MAQTNTHTPRQSRFIASVSVFYGWAMFNYLLRSLSGHSGVDYRHTEPLLPLNYTSASIRLTLLSHRGFGTFAGWYKTCRPCQGFSDSCAIMDINMSGMNSDQLHRSTLGIYSVGNRYCVCVGQWLKLDDQLTYHFCQADMMWIHTVSFQIQGVFPFAW